MNQVNNNKNNVDKSPNLVDKNPCEADVVIWLWLKEEANELKYGTFNCMFTVHGGRVVKASVSQHVKTKACCG